MTNVLFPNITLQMLKFKNVIFMGKIFDCVGGLTTCQPLWDILCSLPEKGEKKIEEIVEEMKERNRGERGTEMKEKKQK